MRKILALFLTLGLIFTMVACSSDKEHTHDENPGTEATNGKEQEMQVQTDNTIKEICFTHSVDYLKQFEGKTVTINGFMSLLLPLNNSSFYLMNTPFQSCPFCVSNDEVLTNTIAVKGLNIEFTTMPIQVTGKLVFGEFKDEYGYEYTYQIENAEVGLLPEDEIPEGMSVYCDVSRNGYIDELYIVIDWMDQIAYYEEYGIDPNLILGDGLVDFCCYEEIKAFVEGINQDGKYDNFIQLLDNAEELSLLINAELQNNNIEACKTYQEKSDELYKDFCEFINQFEF